MTHLESIVSVVVFDSEYMVIYGEEVAVSWHEVGQVEGFRWNKQQEQL